jgi:hypothetical protein
MIRSSVAFARHCTMVSAMLSRPSSRVTLDAAVASPDPPLLQDQSAIFRAGGGRESDAALGLCTAPDIAADAAAVIPMDNSRTPAVHALI